MPHATDLPPDPAWCREILDEAGLAVDTYAAWPSYCTVLPDRTVHYQLIDGDAGSVFVSFGPGATLEAVLGPILGSRDRVEIVSDEQFIRGERMAHAVTLVALGEPLRVYREDAALGIVDEDLPAHRMHLKLIGLQTTRGPSVAGYRVLEARRVELEPILERILASVAEHDG